MWHVMHQANWTDWAHLVSTDLIHWTRIPSALFPNGDWDGSLTLLDGKPVIMYDCYNLVDCLPPNTTGPLGDNPFVGVARPKDPSDQNLTEWSKDQLNPVYLQDTKGAPITRGFAGPSNLWRGQDGNINMLMQLGDSIARFESSDARLHNWTEMDPAFFLKGGRGGHGSTGVTFFKLPATVTGSESSPLLETVANAPTHVLGGTWSNGDPNYNPGLPWYYLGHYDEASGNFSDVTPAQPIEEGGLTIWSTSHVEASGRMLYLGWFNYGLGCLTAPRALTYDPAFQKLLANPVKELASLRTASLGSLQDVSLKAGEGVSVFGSKNSTTFDLVAEISLPSGAAVSYGAAIMAATQSNAEILLAVDVSKPESGAIRVVNVSIGVPFSSPRTPMNSTFSFQLPDAASMELRVLGDRAIVEVFVGSGRGVFTTAPLAPGKDKSKSGFFLFAAESSPSTVVIKSVSAWAMGCGWA